jgi:hypothetical protein
MNDNERDPAVLRFWALQFTRVMGVGFIIVGMLVSTDRILPQLPQWAGWLLIAMGMAGVFVLPVMMARKWRTPK